MRPTSVFLLALLCTACDCKDDPGGGSRDGGQDGGDGAVEDATLDGTIGDGGDGSVGDAGDGGLVGEGCEERARWIYVVDSDDNFFRFEPDALMFHQIGAGPLACPNTATDGGMSHPFSMAIDENAVAYVLYDDGDLYRVSTLDGTCEATPYVPGQMGFTQFGMGFSSNAPSPDRMGETLYIARGLSSDDELATLNVNTYAVTYVADITGVPELTGNGNAELWGFFPENMSSTIRKMNKATGATITSYDLTTSTPDTISAGNRNAWAFAFWGGSYYVFYKTTAETSTDVYRLTPGPTVPTSTFTRVIDNSGRRIVGAGVSTCAPIIID
jgi:hypothetical protein